MHFSSLVFSLLLVCYVDAQESEVAAAFRENNLVPNILDEAPEQLIRVNYSNVMLTLGNKLNPLQTLLEPIVTYEADPDELYTLIFFGPDLPIDLIPKYTQFLHWLVVNIRGADIASGRTVSSYFPPVPYPGGFPYLFVLYKQTKEIESGEADSLSFILKRPGFDVVEFKKENNLVGPVAGNFMRQAYLAPSFIEGLLSKIVPNLSQVKSILPF